MTEWKQAIQQMSKILGSSVFAVRPWKRIEMAKVEFLQWRLLGVLGSKQAKMYDGSGNGDRGSKKREGPAVGFQVPKGLQGVAVVVLTVVLRICRCWCTPTATLAVTWIGILCSWETLTKW